MDQITHIRLSGHAEPVALTTSAHARLLRYLADARDALAGDPGADEIVRDLEESLGDQMHQLLDATGSPVDDQQLRELLERAGAVEGSTPPPIGGGADRRGPFWCRIQTGKWFGGLCLGVAAHGGFRVDWVRTVVLLLTVFTGGFIGLVYLALLLVLPSVDSVAEYEWLRDAPSNHTL